MLRTTILMVIALACAWANADLLLAQTRVVVGAGTAEEPRTANQFEYAIAAAAGRDDANHDIVGALIWINFVSSVDDIKTVSAVAERIDFFSEDGVPVRAEIHGTAEVKLRHGRRILSAPARFLVSESRVDVELDLDRMGVATIDGLAFSGGNSFGTFEPELIVIALGQGSTVPSAAQAAAVIDAEQRAIGRLSLLANPDNGDLVRVEGVADNAAVGFNVGRRRLRLHLAGLAAVDVFRPDGTSPDTCFGDFTFVQNAGPHGPFRIDAPDCRDPLAGIEGSDIGSGCGNVAAASWPPAPGPRPFPGAPGSLPD